jgi:hypothetical protein
VKISFAGGSDDIVTVTTPDGTEEYYTYERGPIMWHADVTDGAIQVVRVYALYDGCWSFAAGQVNDDGPMPDWPISIRQDPETRYSALLEIDAPAGTKVRNIWPESGEETDDADA